MTPRRISFKGMPALIVGIDFLDDSEADHHFGTFRWTVGTCVGFGSKFYGGSLIHLASGIADTRRAAMKAALDAIGTVQAKIVDVVATMDRVDKTELEDYLRGFASKESEQQHDDVDVSRGRDCNET